MPKEFDDDLTRIEDLSEYEHDEDTAVNRQLSTHKNENKEENTQTEDHHNFAGLDHSSPSLQDPFENTKEEISSPPPTPDDQIFTPGPIPTFDQNQDDASPFTLSEDAIDTFSDPETFEEQNEEDLSFSASDSSMSEELPSPPLSPIEPLESFPQEEITFNNEEPPLKPESATFAEPIHHKPLTERETFSDVANFGKNFTYGNIAIGGNPPYSLLIRNVKYKEDAEEILRQLSEHDLLKDDTRSLYEKGLANGSILISQLSEYSAIYLAHKLRRLDIEILIGLSEEIHPSKNVEKNFRGLVKKESLSANKKLTEDFRHESIRREEIITTTLNSLSNLSIDRYLGIITTTRKIEEGDLLEITSIHEAETKKSPLDGQYQILINELKDKAIKLGGNGIVGINFSITPITISEGEKEFQITATGNVVWLTDKGVHARN